MSQHRKSEPTSNLPNSTERSNNDLFVVGIGASAGGLSALEQLFDRLPTESGAAFVVIQHLSPDFKSLMQELLQRHTDMKVYRVTEGMELKPNSVYLIPPGKNLILESKLLRLGERRKNENDRYELNFPIDLFFTSLAKNYQERAIGVILSGSGSDGTHGLRAINEAGGVALVQDPETAEFDGMPRSAIATGVVNQVLPPHELAQLIYKCIVSPREDLEIDSHENSLITSYNLQQVAELLRETENIDFSHYKTSTVSRRIHRRRLINNLEDISTYIKLLRDSEAERRILCSDLLINVTHFFRDTAAWDNLENNILPVLIERATTDEELRFWVAGCSTGEEAYSLAILLHEAMEDLNKPQRVKVFATDIDRTALEKASAGIYPQSIVNHISPERLQKYFTPKDDCFQVTRKLREILIFSPQDLTRDAGFTRMHLISCRNVLIYMQSDLQQQVLRNLHFSLLTKGVLFLGEAESTGIYASEFKTLDKKWKIYQKRRDVKLIFPAGSKLSRISPNLYYHPTKTKVSSAHTKSIHEYSFRRLFNESNSVILLVSPDQRLLHVYGDASKLFKPPQGEIITDATKMVVLPLQLPLSTALHRAKKERKSVIYSEIKIEPAGDPPFIVSLKVIPPEKYEESGDFYLVQIDQQKVAPSLQNIPTHELEVQTEAQQRITELEHELQYTRENLQALIEELETTNEEQQASNEELTASNEELQSTNEELHSVNEELHTVNIEYQSKILELTQLNNDIDNLLKSTEIGVIFLDSELKIRKFTPAATAAVSLRHTDVERPLQELTLKIECPELLTLLKEVQSSQQPIELEVKQQENNSYLLMRVHPYHDENYQSQEIVLSFVKIDEIKAVQLRLENTLSELKNKETEINNFFDLSLELMCVGSADGYFRRINPSFERILGYTQEELLSQPIINFIHPDDVESTRRELQRLEESHDTVGFENRYICQDGSHRWFKWMATSYQGLNYCSAHDLTEQKLAQELLYRQLAAIETASDGIAILNDDKFIYLNQAHLEIFGYRKSEELIGQSWHILYEPEELARLEQEAFPILKERGRWQGEAIAKRFDNHTFDEELTLTITSAGDLICVCRDITEIKQAQQQILQTNVELERRVAKRTQTLADFSDRIKQLHRLATTSYEQLEDLLNDYLQTGCQMFNLNSGVVSQTTDNTSNILAMYSSLDFAATFEADFKDIYGAEIVVNGQVFGTLNFSDTIVGERELESHEQEIVELMARDIGHAISAWQSKTAIENSEKRFRSTFEQAAVGVAHISPEGKFIRVNQRLCEIVGYDSDLLLKLTFQEITHPDDLQVGVEHLRQMLTGEIFNFSMEKRYIHCNGSIIWGHLTISLVKDNLGAPDYFIAVIEDISDRKQTETALEESRNKLKQANKAKDVFIAHMSHELRTPLTSILGFSNLLQRDSQLSSKQLHFVDIVHGSGRHLLNLINDILDFSKITAEKLQLEPENFNLVHFLSEIATVFRVRTQQKGLTFQAEISPSLPTIVNADETRLRQVLFNLLSNGIKFTDKGTVTLKVNYIENFAVSNQESSTKNNDDRPSSTADPSQSISLTKIRFQVEDTGIGIPIDKCDTIFNPFEQLNGRAKKYEGTGLGLTISQNIIQLMGSQIKLQSQVDRGSKFWFDLELLPVETNILPSSSDSSIRPAYFLRIPCKVLIVDDNDDNRALLVNYLKPFGFIVEEAMNGEDGLATAETFQPDVILVDLVMPVMDGKEMVRRIKQQHQFRDTVIIMISANSKLILKPSEVDCHGFLSKPVNLEALMNLLNSHLQLEWETGEFALVLDSLSKLVTPPQQELIKLLELADLGDMDSINEQINYLETLDSKYRSFAQEVRKLAVNFQQQQLENLIEGFINN